jgi:hypothetical protein
LFAVTNTSSGENPLAGKDSFILIRDKDISLPAQVNGRLLKTKYGGATLSFERIDVLGQRQSGDPDGLLFPLGEIAPGHSRVLGYSLEFQIATVASNVAIEKIELKPSELGSEEFIDISLKQLTQAQVVDLSVEMIDDSTVPLNSRAEAFSLPAIPADFEGDFKGMMSLENRKGEWSLQLKPDKPKLLRIRLGG